MEAGGSIHPRETANGPGSGHDEPIGYRKNLAGAFRSHIINSRLVDSVTAAAPVRLLGSTSFLYMRKNDVYILAVTKNNANAMSTFYFMNSVSISGRLSFCCSCLLG